MRGTVTRLFKMTCGICAESHISEPDEFKSIDAFIEAMTDGQWRVSADNGFIHRKCQKMMPASIEKFFTS